jgi:pilus assembly protein CpaB
VNLIVTMSFLDLDTNFQTVLPNDTAGVIAPGTDLSSSTGAPENKSSSIVPVHQNIVAQLVYGGSGSVVGRAEIDTGLSQPIYVVPSEAQRPRMVSQTLLQDAMILQVGNFETEADKAAAQAAAPTAAPGTAQSTAVAATAKAPDVVTLVVAPQDAITLNYLMFNNAQLTLALRGAGDDQRVQTDAVTLQYLMDQYNIPVPAKLPYGVDGNKTSLAAPVLTNDIPTPAPR